MSGNSTDDLTEIRELSVQEPVGFSTRNAATTPTFQSDDSLPLIFNEESIFHNFMEAFSSPNACVNIYISRALHSHIAT